MLHDKFFYVLREFIGDYKKQVYGRGLKGIPFSGKAIALALKELEQKGVLKSNIKGKLRFYSLNVNYSEIMDVIAIAELFNKITFLSKNRTVANLFSHDRRIVGVFGSYAKGVQKEDSDLDMFIIGEKKERDYDAVANKFDLNVNIKYYSHEEWKKLLGEKNTLFAEMLSNHIIIFGIENFISDAWRYYYGFN